MKKPLALLISCLLLWLTLLPSGFTQAPGLEDCHAVVLIKRFDVSRFNGDPALADLTTRVLTRVLQAELGPVVTIITAPEESSQQADFEVSGFYERVDASQSVLQVDLLNRKQGDVRTSRRHPFSAPVEITRTVEKAGEQLAEEIFESMDCNLGGMGTSVAEGQCFQLSFSGVSNDTLNIFEDPIHGKVQGIHENEARKDQRHQGNVIFVVSSEVVDPMKYAHLATPELINAGNQTLQDLRQHIPGAAQMEQDLRQVLPPDDKPYQSIWGDGDYTGQLTSESADISMGDSMMGQDLRRQGSSASGEGESNVKGRLVEGMAYLELSASAEADYAGQTSQKVMFGGGQSSVPWEPIMNQPGQKASLGIPSVPFKMPLRDGASTTVNYTPNLALPGLAQGKFAHRLHVRLKRLPDSAEECQKAKSVPDPDKAMRQLLDMMGPDAGNAFGQMFQGVSGTPDGNGPEGGQPQPPAYHQQAPSGYQTPMYQNHHPQQLPEMNSPPPYQPSSSNDEDDGWIDEDYPSDSEPLSPGEAVDTLRYIFGF